MAGRGNRRVMDENEIIGPTPRRLGHGQVMRLERSIADAQGGVGRPWQTLDTLARMERQGSITAPMRRAGNRFHDDFRLASLDPLSASDPARIPVRLKSAAAVRPHKWGSEAARLSVVSALDALGGLQRRAGPAPGTSWVARQPSRNGRSRPAGRIGGSLATWPPAS